MAAWLAPAAALATPNDPSTQPGAVPDAEQRADNAPGHGTVPGAVDDEQRANASAAGDGPVTDPSVLALARGHFDNGVRLYQDANYSGALVEFEAAYRLKPGASSLQNIALCQKALFRYTQAAATLGQLLTRHGDSLAPAERQLIESAKRELESLTRRVIVRLSPKSAELRLDGQRVDATAWRRGARLDVGEHQLSATAPGYASVTETIRISSGEGPLRIDLALEPVAGFVTIVTEQAGAAIAVDGRALDYDRWSGPLEPGEHVLQIYKPGHETVEELFDVELGAHKLIHANAGGELEESALGAGAPVPLKRGWYGMGTFNLMLVPDAPDGVRVSDTFSSGALSWGGRAGYRVLDPLGIEVLLEGGYTRVDDACIEAEDQKKWGGVAASCEPDEPDHGTLSYSINAFRLGGNLRLFSQGSRTRFTSTLGFGAVQHRFQLTQPNDSGFDAQALNAYVLVEVGVQFNLGHLLLETDFVTYVESHGSLGNDERDLFNEGGLKSLGLGIKAGYSEWLPF